jgi:metal-responsive CopG/Arc/MetJ family transcriptional regulator
MAETQVIFRIDNKLLQKFDSILRHSGFRTRNEWFRSKVREFLEDMERKEALKAVRALTVKGMTEREIVKMVKDWRKEKAR